VALKESGKTGFAHPNTATYNDTSAESAVTDSVKQVGTALMTLNMFKGFIERFYVASQAYVLVAKSALPS